MPFKIVRNDLVKMKTDAIVNAANTRLQMDGGLSEAIFKAAGSKELQKECDTIGVCKVGEAVITKGYKLYAKYIIHTVGPIWKGGSFNEGELLYNSYRNSLHLALNNGVKSIAFPLIASGVYGYPKEKSLKIAKSAIGDFLLKHDMEVYLVVYGQESVLLGEKLFDKVAKYIDDNYVEEKSRRFKSYKLEEDLYEVLEDKSFLKKRDLIDVISKQEETFSEMLLRLIDQKQMTDVEVYKRANIDRRLFSKIRSDKDYKPSKITAIAFSIALNLNLDETYDLLQRAGYALSPSSKFDIIIEFFIKSGNYDVYEINEALFSFDQNLLGA